MQICFLLINIIASLTGVYGSGFIRDISRTRYFLGYGWVNRAPYCLLFICVELLYIFPGWFSLWKGIGVGALNLWLYYKTGTLYPMVITFALIAVGLYVRVKLEHNKKYKINIRLVMWLGIILFLCTCISQFVLPLLFDGTDQNWVVINKFVNSRLSYGQEAIKLYGLHLWGNEIEWVGASTLMFGLSESSTYFYVDSGFLQIALDNGLVFAAALFLIYLISYVKLYRQNELSGLFSLIILSIVFLFEPYVLDFAFNPFILLAFSSKIPSMESNLKVKQLRKHKRLRFKVSAL